MRLLHYLELQNFKRFGDRQRIELDHPSVLIGPNNCGKRPRPYRPSHSGHKPSKLGWKTKAQHRPKNGHQHQSTGSTSSRCPCSVRVTSGTTWPFAPATTTSTFISPSASYTSTKSSLSPCASAIRATNWSIARPTNQRSRGQTSSKQQPNSMSNCYTPCRVSTPKKPCYSPAASTYCSAKDKQRKCSATSA